MSRRTGFQLFGQAIRAAMYPAPRDQWQDPESVLGRLVGALPPPGALHPLFRGRDLFNGPIYAMLRLHPRPRLMLDCRPGWYFDSMNTCERLELEGRYRNTQPPHPLWRDGAGRTAGIGISTVVAWREAGTWVALAGRVQPKSMPERAGQIHVAPSGMFAPPFSVTENVRRELLEETGLALEPGALQLTGVAVNLLNLRPEICTLLITDGRPAAVAGEEFQGPWMAIPLPINAAGLSARAPRETFTVPAAAALRLAARLLCARGRA